MTHKLLPLAALLLALGLAAPAWATTTVNAANSPFIVDASNSPFTDNLVVQAGGELGIVDGGAVTVASGHAVTVDGGTVHVSGGSAASTDSEGMFTGMIVASGTVSISGGSVSSWSDGVVVQGGTVRISGGSVSGGSAGVSVSGGTASISGGSVSGKTGVLVEGGTASISGGSVSSSSDPRSGGAAGSGVEVNGGTVNISGGSVSGSSIQGTGVFLFSGTANISGGVVSSVAVVGGMASISGGVVSLVGVGGGTASISGGSIGVGPDKPSLIVSGGTLTVVGCNLTLLPSSPFPQLTGILADGSLINTHAQVLSPGQLLLTAAYTWGGVLQPLNADGTSVFRAGSTVPVRFQLTGAAPCVSSLAPTLSVVAISDGVAGPVNEPVATGAASSGNQFRYSGGQYFFNWSTRGLLPGTYELQIDLGDGLIRTVTVGLR